MSSTLFEKDFSEETKNDIQDAAYIGDVVLDYMKKIR